MDHCTRKLLSLTGKNLFFEEDGIRANLIHAKLSDIQAIAVNVVSKMKDKSSRMDHTKQKSNFCLIEQQKQNYT